MTDELKPCPFCGAPGAPYHSGDGEYNLAGCDKECHGFPEAVSLWNTRPIEDELRGQLSQLKDDRELAERAMRAAYAWMNTSDGTTEDWSRIVGLLKSALRIG